MKITLKVNEDLSLINPGMEHAKDLFELVDANRDFLNQYIPFAKNKETVAHIKSFLREIASFNIGGQKFNLILNYKGRLVGIIGFHRIDRLNARAEIGYWIGEAFQGLGLMSAAIPVFLDYGFNALGVNKVELLTLSSHKRNISMVNRLGFRQEGVLKEHYFMHDDFQEAIQYGMLRSEFGGC